MDDRTLTFPLRRAILVGIGLLSTLLGLSVIVFRSIHSPPPVEERPRNVITTLAGTGLPGSSGDGGSARRARLTHCMTALAMDAKGNLYVGDSYSHRVRKITPDVRISTVVGCGMPGYRGDGGLATDARISNPKGLAVDALGNLYVSDASFHCIRKVTPDGIIHTLAGTGRNGFSGDGGPASFARLDHPRGLALDVRGNLYVVDSWNRRLRCVHPNGVITTVAGSGLAKAMGNGGPAWNAGFLRPSEVTVDHAGNLYVVDNGASQVRKIDTEGRISLVAGNGIWGYAGDDGPATQARLRSPGSIAVDRDGNLFIADAANYRLRKVSPDGIITTVAGGESWGFKGDGGSATHSVLDYPASVVLDAYGNLFFTDSQNRRIRRITWLAAPGLFRGKTLTELRQGNSHRSA